MFGFTIVRKSWLKELEDAHWVSGRVAMAHRWFSGWKDLDVIWDLLMNFSRSVQLAREDYARARGTDEYGKPQMEAIMRPEEFLEKHKALVLDYMEAAKKYGALAGEFLELKAELAAAKNDLEDRVLLRRKIASLEARLAAIQTAASGELK